MDSVGLLNGGGGHQRVCPTTMNKTGIYQGTFPHTPKATPGLFCSF
jgi:hypothetical protein